MKQASMWRSLVLGLTLLCLAGASARADTVPAKLQGLLLLRTLAYDHNLANRVESKRVTIVVLHKSDAGGEAAANQLVGAIREIAKSTTLSGNAINVVRLAYAETTFAADISKTKVAALFVTSGLADNVGTITATSRKQKLLSFTTESSYVSSGVSVGFTVDNTKPIILVNLPASRAEGADLDTALLRVAKIVKK